MRDDLIPLSPDRLPPPVVERLQMPLVVPMRENGPSCTAGVFGADGRFRQMSRTLLSVGLSGVPELEEAPFAEIVPGRWLFAGLGRNHFGHFLVETLIRLWAVKEYRDELDGIVIIPKYGMDFAGALKRRFGRFLSLLTDGLPVHLAEYPTRYETLLLPAPGFGPQAWITGTDLYRRNLRGKIAEKIAPDGPERLYISRSALAKTEKHVHDEARIEALMRRAGYEIFHPEQHPIEQQLARYRAARVLVGGDGSAFHLAPFALSPGARAGLIQRRRELKVEDFTAQLRAFARAKVHVIKPVLPLTGAAPDPDEGAAPIDFDVVEEELDGAGFL